MFSSRRTICCVLKHQIIAVRLSSSSSQQAAKWDLMCGICLERKPSLTRPLNKLELSLSAMLKQIEYEKSQKSLFELKKEADLKRTLEFQKGKILTEDMDKAIGQTAAEFEDACVRELEAFKPASRLTEADEKNDTKSTERLLDKHLLFLLNTEIRGNKLWLLPQDLVQEGETLRQAAERIVKETCGSSLRAKFYGNAPCGFYKYKYPKDVRTEKNVVGAKIFFMKAQYQRGSINEQNILDYTWASREELNKHLPEIYRKAISSFLIDDETVDL